VYPLRTKEAAAPGIHVHQTGANHGAPLFTQSPTNDLDVNMLPARYIPNTATSLQSADGSGVIEGKTLVLQCVEAGEGSISAIAFDVGGQQGIPGGGAWEAELIMERLGAEEITTSGIHADQGRGDERIGLKQAWTAQQQDLRV
jgi:hypothetical protein